MYPNLSDQPPANIHEFVSARQVRFGSYSPEFQSATQKRPLLSKFHGSTYQVNQNVLLLNPVVPVRTSPKFFSPWRGPYVILQCLNEVTYRIQEIATQKELIVHYDRLKAILEPPTTSNVLTRDRRNPKNVSPPSPRQHEQILPKFDHDQCTWHYPYHTVPSATTCCRGVACTTPTAMPASATTPIGSPKSVLPSPSSSYS